VLGRAVAVGHVLGADTGLRETDHRATNVAERDHLIRQAARMRAAVAATTGSQTARWNG
jgi:hypothetical protein